MKSAQSWIVSALILSTTGLSPAQTSSTHTTVRHHREAVQADDGSAEVAEAEEAMAKKDFTAAEKILLTATSKDGKNYRAWFDLGYVYNATERQEQAIAAYRKAVAANPEVFESNLNLGIMLARTGDPEAETFLRQATELKPSAHEDEGRYRAWVSLGHALEKSKPKDALEAFQKAAELQPKEAEPHLSAGLLLEGQKQYPAAAAEYQKAAEVDPKSAEALAGLVNAYSQSQQFPEAESALRRFIALDPNNATAHVQLGRVLAIEHKWDDATAELEQGLKLHPGDLEAERQLASIYMGQKNYDAAVPHLQVALKAAPRDAELYYWAGQALLNMKKFPEAQKVLEVALKLKPDMGEAWGELAIAASENKNYQLCLQALEARGKFLPESPMTYFLRATTFDHLQDAKQAAANYHKFLDASAGRYPDEEWKAKHRLIAIEPKR